MTWQNYTAGLPSATLYVKNIAKEVTEYDLRFVFGESSEVNPSDGWIERAFFELLGSNLNSTAVWAMNMQKKQWRMV